jgi:hypothetical protein
MEGPMSSNSCWIAQRYYYYYYLVRLRGRLIMPIYYKSHNFTNKGHIGCLGNMEHEHRYKVTAYINNVNTM